MTKLIGIALLLSFMVGCKSMEPDIKTTHLIDIPAQDINSFIAAAEKTEENYRSHYADKEKLEWDTGTANLLGGTVGAIGAVAHSIPVAGIGAVTVGTAEMLSRFYGVEKQNDAYTKAAAATQCLIVLAENLSKPEVLKNFLSPDGRMAADTFVVVSLNKGMRRVESKLIERLRKRAVSTSPDFTAFETYLSARLKAGTAPGVSGFKVSANSVEAALESQIAAAIAQLEADIGVCVTTF